jgi:hypothetical protein
MRLRLDAKLLGAFRRRPARRGTRGVLGHVRGGSRSRRGRCGSRREAPGAAGRARRPSRYAPLGGVAPPRRSLPARISRARVLHFRGSSPRCPGPRPGWARPRPGLAVQTAREAERGDLCTVAPGDRRSPVCRVGREQHATGGHQHSCGHANRSTARDDPTSCRSRRSRDELRGTQRAGERPASAMRLREPLVGKLLGRCRLQTLIERRGWLVKCSGWVRPERCVMGFGVSEHILVGDLERVPAAQHVGSSVGDERCVSSIESFRRVAPRRRTDRTGARLCGVRDHGSNSGTGARAVLTGGAARVGVRVGAVPVGPDVVSVASTPNSPAAVSRVTVAGVRGERRDGGEALGVRVAVRGRGGSA